MIVDSVNVPDDALEDLKAFSDAVEHHPWGGPFECCFVVATDGIQGLKREYERRMKPAEYANFLREDAVLGGVSGGMVFYDRNDTLTAVVVDPIAFARESGLPIPKDEKPSLLRFGAHELVEAARKAHRTRAGWEWPRGGTRDAVRRQLGLTLFGEYVAERVRFEIGHQLGWPRSELDAPDLIRYSRAMHQMLLDRPLRGRRAPPEFQSDWIAMARLWTETLGRRDAGSQRDGEELHAFANIGLIEDQGWNPVERVISDLYERPKMDYDERARVSAERIYDPIVQYSERAWRPAQALPGE